MSQKMNRVPERVCDTNGIPLFGAYEGLIPDASLTGLADQYARKGLGRIRSEKTWYYTCIAGPEWVAGLAIIQMGYAAASFVYLFDRVNGRFELDEQSLAPPFLACKVHPRPGDGADASFRLPGYRASILNPPGPGFYQVRIRMNSHGRIFDLAAELDQSQAPAGMTAICPVAGAGSINLTAKQVALPAKGRLILGDRTVQLDEGYHAVLDYSHGYLSHRTAWMWACAGGRTKQGKPMGLNLVAGFNDSLENTIWLGDDLIPVGKVSFHRGTSGPKAPWTIKSEDGRVNLTFQPEGTRSDQTDMGPISTHYVQPIGTFSGTVTSPKGRKNKVDKLLGITEEHLSRW